LADKRNTPEQRPAQSYDQHCPYFFPESGFVFHKLPASNMKAGKLKKIDELL